MKKWIYIILIIIIIIIAILIGNYLFRNSNKIQNQNTNRIVTNYIQQENVVQENIFVNDIIVSSQKEKISPNATLILKKHYEECDHIIKEYVKIPEEYVNLTRGRIREKARGMADRELFQG